MWTQLPQRAERCLIHLMGCGKTDSGPLEEQYVRITAAPLLQPPSTHSGLMQKGSHGGYEQRSCSDDSRATL